MLLIVGGVVALFIIILISDAWPWLRGPRPETSEWYWPYRLRPLVRLWPALLTGFLLGVVGTWWVCRPSLPSRRRETIVLAALVALQIGLQLALVYADRAAVAAELLDRTLAIDTSGYFWTAAQIDDPVALLRNYPERMPQFDSEHARTHPPGLVLLNRWLMQLTARFPHTAERLAGFVWPQRCTDLWLLDQPAAVPAALALAAFLPMAAAALTVVPLYGLAKSLLEFQEARLAAVLASVIPALALFAPLVDQLYPLLTVTAFWLTILALRKRSLILFFTVGLFLSVLSFLSIGNALLVIPLAVIIALTLRSRDEPWSWWAKIAAAAAAGCGSIWIIYWMISGAAPWNVALVGLNQHYELVTTLRNYRWWIIWNLIDLIIFAGPLLILGFLGSFFIFKKAQKSMIGRLAIGLVVMVILLNFSGSTRGEVGRIWLFWMPLLAIPAAVWWGKLHAGPGAVWGSIAILLALGIAWQPVTAVIVVAERPQMADAAPENLINEKLGDHVVLEGYTQVMTDQSIDLTLFWTASRPTVRPYVVFNHLTSADDNTLVAQADGWSVDGVWPPTCWRAGERIVDRFTIPLDELPAGAYQLQTGLYDRRDNSRLATPSGATAIVLQPVVISSDNP